MKKKKGHLGLSNSFHYTLMVLPGYIWLFMFSIVPMVGIVMAFQDYNPSKGWFGSPWVGLKWFKYLTVIPDAKRALVNTLIIADATGRKTPCGVKGVCMDCQSPDCMCCSIVVTRRSRYDGRIKVVIVGENLGY